MEKGFWFSLTLAFVIWIVTKVGLLIADIFGFADWIALVANYGYFAFFLCFLFALQLVTPSEESRKELSFSYTLNQWLSLTFMGMMFVYLIIISQKSFLSTNQAISAEQNYSSFLFYFVMDVFLLSMCLRRAAANQQPHWQNRLFWFALSYGLFLLSDIIELLARTGHLSVDLNGVVSLLWYLPYLTLLLGIRVPEQKNHQEFAPTKPLRAFLNKLPSATTILLMTLPVIHFAGYHFELLSPEAKSARELVLFIWIMLFAAFIHISSNNNTDDSSKRDIENTGGILEDASISSYLHTIPFPCFLLNNKGLIQMCNPAALNMFGYSEANLENSPFAGLMDKDEPLIDLLRYSETSFSDSQLFTNAIREIHCHHRAGHKLYCYIAFSKATTDSTLVSLVDITSLHDAEVQALSIKDKFLANITHEFRTPLTIIQGVIDEGLEKKEDMVFHKRLLAARSNSVRVLKMVEQLLNLSKITSAPKLEFIPQSASQIINESCRQFEQLCKRKSIQFTSNIVAGIWVNVHEDALEQVLYNLLSNAYKYSDPNSSIQVTSAVNGKVLHIRIADTGYGMSEEEQTKLFERFQRADSARSSATFGVGIGLSLVSELIAAHEWHISVDSELNKGTTFSLQIPVVEAPAMELQPERQKDYYADLTGLQNLNREFPREEGTSEILNRLLVIEDNPDMQDHLYHLLSPYYQVDIKGTGQGGIDAAISELPDVIVCDLMLPDVSGFEVVEQLKTHELTQHIPIIMLTAKADNQSKLTGLEKQADDYLTKPFNHRELKLRIDNLLNLREKIQVLLRGQLATLGAVEAPVANHEEAPNFQVLPHQKFLDKLQKVAEKHYAIEDFSTSQLASELAMSERQLQRKLKAALDITPGEYIREYRLIKARELLKTGMSVGQVAEEVGFSSQNYFARCFKLQSGQTPSEFQKSLAQ